MLLELHRPERYRAQLEYLHAKHGDGPRLHALTHEGVPLARFIRDKVKVSRTLARAVAGGQYQPSPARVRRVLLDKERDLFSLTASDLVVHGVFATLLAERMEPQLSPRLYSYRKGRSSWKALRDLAAYVRGHRKEHADPRSRGIYVFRGDVAAYGDSIPFAAWSPIWDQLRQVLGLAAADHDDPTWALVRALIRPLVDGDDGPWTPCVGVATGSPIATVLANLYLDPLDKQLEAIEGGAYARFGDDIMFCHPDYGVFRDAVDRVGSLLEDRCLHINSDKERQLFFNGAGRRSAQAPELAGGREVEYLGCRLSFDGTVGLSRDKCVDLLDDVARRVQRSSRLLGDAALEERGRALCQTVNEALDPGAQVCTRYAALLRHAVTDRSQLKELDYAIAREVVAALTGRHSAKSFREVSYRRVRRDWGLTSLVWQRNREGGG